MKKVSTSITLLLAGAVILSLGACSSGGGGDDNGTTPSTSPPPYPDPKNPSAFPTKKDDLEGGSGDNSFSDANVMNIGEKQYHTIYPLQDIDWVKVTLEAGTQYEFSVDNVSYNATLPLLELYRSDGSTQVTGAEMDDNSFAGYFANNPRLLYTADSSDTYYLKIYDFGVSSYTLSSRIFDDSGDSDTYSPHYDCNILVASIYPWATEVVGDTIDQSCSGYDWPSPTSLDFVDATTPDNGFTTAGSLPMFGGDPFDIIHRGDIYSETHTLHVGDVDYFKVTVPAKTLYEFFDIETSSGALFDFYVYEAPDTTTPIFEVIDSGSISEVFDNTLSASATDYYLKVTIAQSEPAGTTATYVLGVGDLGSDADLDTKYTRGQGLGWDCDDTDPTIYGGAADPGGDGVDSDCDGIDG